MTRVGIDSACSLVDAQSFGFSDQGGTCIAASLQYILKQTKY